MSEERFFGYTKAEILNRTKKWASQVRAVDSHSDLHYRRAISSVLQTNSLPMAVIRDLVAFELPRLEDTSIEGYFSEGTEVDPVRLERIVSELTTEGQLSKEIHDFDGFEIEIYKMGEK